MGGNMSILMDNQINHGNSVRVHTRASQPRTSSNLSFQEQFRSGLKTGIDLTNSAVRQIARPIPGSAAISASLSDAARSLAGPSSVGGPNMNISSGVASVSGGLGGGGGSGPDDMGSLQDEMFKNNNDLLDKQLQVSQFTTTVMAKSNLMKAYFDALKAIGANLR